MEKTRLGQCQHGKKCPTDLSTRYIKFDERDALIYSKNMFDGGKNGIHLCGYDVAQSWKTD